MAIILNELLASPFKSSNQNKFLTKWNKIKWKKLDQIKKQQQQNAYINPLPPSDAVLKKKYFRGSFQFSVVTV